MRGFDRVVVCSYGRSDTVYRDTISALLTGGVLPEEIEVHTPQVDQYESTLAGEVRVVPAPVGLHNAQNAALEKASVGERIVFADDDVRSIDQPVRGREGKLRLSPVGDLPDLYRQAFDHARREHVTLWGLYPVHNAFYMKPRVRLGLWFCIGQMFGVIVTPDRQYGSEVAAKKGDYERTLLHFQRDGAVMRMDWLAANCAPMRTAAGGNASPERAEQERAAVRDLMRRWPGLVHPKPDRMGYPEISLRMP